MIIIIVILKDTISIIKIVYSLSKNRNNSQFYFILLKFYRIFYSTENQLKSIKMLMIIAFLLSICNIIKAQILASSGLTSILIFPQLSLEPFINSSFPSSQTNKVISFAENHDYIYVLSTNNAIQVHQKANPNNIVSNMLQFCETVDSNLTIILNVLINDIGDILIAIGT